MHLRSKTTYQADRHSQRVQQGSVLMSYILQLIHGWHLNSNNVYISDANDLSIISIPRDANTYSTQAYITQFEKRLLENSLKVATTRFTSTFLTSHNKKHQQRPAATVNDTIIPHMGETKILIIQYTSSSNTSHTTHLCHLHHKSTT